jgi:hypothetical protein
MTSPLDRVWSDIAADPATDGLVRRRILPALIHDVFAGEQRPSHRRILILDIKDDPLGLPHKRPTSRGLSLELSTSADTVHLRLLSTSAAGDPLFLALTADVVSVLERNPGSGAAARVVDRVIAWQMFFAARPEDFTPDRAAGLFSELSVLSTLFQPTVGASQALVAWCGPDPAVQDFQHGAIAVEVKSFRGTGPGHLLISSERQLETTGVGDLYLAYLRLDQRPDGTGVTLAEAISTLRKSLEGFPFASDLLEERLLNYGWHDSLRDRMTDKYEIRSTEFFHVAAGFPRITSPELPGGVRGVSYSVDRSAIEGFLISGPTLADRLKEYA